MKLVFFLEEPSAKEMLQGILPVIAAGHEQCQTGIKKAGAGISGNCRFACHCAAIDAAEQYVAQF